MTPQEFKTWRLECGLTHTKAAQELGVYRRLIGIYSTGIKRGKPIEIPIEIELQCAKIALRISSERRVALAIELVRNTGYKVLNEQEIRSAAIVLRNQDIRNVLGDQHRGVSIGVGGAKPFGLGGVK